MLVDITQEELERIEKSRLADAEFRNKKRMFPWKRVGDLFQRQTLDGVVLASVWYDSDDPYLMHENQVSVDCRLFEQGFVEVGNNARISIAD